MKLPIRFIAYLGLWLLLMQANITRAQEKSAQSKLAIQLSRFEDEKTGLWGFQDENGAIIIKPQFDIAYEFTGAIAVVGYQDGLHYIDRSGKILSIRPFIYDNGPDYFREGLARFLDAGKIGFLDETGKIVIKPLTFDFISPFADSLAAVSIGCKVTPRSENAEYDWMTGEKWGYIDRNGKIVIPLKFGAAEPFHNGTARVLRDGTWILISKTGKIINQ